MERFAKHIEKVISFELRGFFGKNKLQKFWRLSRTSYVMYNLLQLYDKSERKKHLICDVGCGPGIVASFFAKRGFNIMGIDMVPALIKFGEEYFEKNGLAGTFSVADITTDAPAIKQGMCSAVVCIDAIEHFKYPMKSILNFKKMLGGRGRVFLTTPNFGNPLFAIMEKAWDFIGKTPGWEHLHVTRLGLKQYTQLFERAGFKIERAGTFLFVSPFVAVFSSKLARLTSRLEQYLMRKLPLGLMIFMTASVNC